MKRIALFAGLVCAISQTFAAGPIYRCGNTYSQVRCPDGKLIDAADPRSAAQRAAAKKATALERERAAQMERDRKAADAASAPASGAAKGKKKHAGTAKRIVPIHAFKAR